MNSIGRYYESVRRKQHALEVGSRGCRRDSAALFASWSAHAAVPARWRKGPVPRGCDQDVDCGGGRHVLLALVQWN